MAHAHISIVVTDTDDERTPLGLEQVPVEEVAPGEWKLLDSPLLATEAVIGDVVRLTDEEAGLFEVVQRGGRFGVHLYLNEVGAKVTERAATAISARLKPWGGTVHGVTREAGMIACSIGVAFGLEDARALFSELLEENDGADWMFTNVYDPLSRELLNWWED